MMSLLSNEDPSNRSTGIDLNPTLSINANDPDGDLMTIQFWTNASGSWAQIGTENTSATNGTYTRNPTNMNNYNTTYYWSVNVSDSMDWTNETYHFTTCYKQIISKTRNAYALEYDLAGSTLYGYINNTCVKTSIDINYHYVVLTYDGNNLKLYKDGQQKDITGLTGTISINADNLLLGKFFSGMLDEIRISKASRDNSWINTSYLNQNSPLTFYSIGNEQTQGQIYLNVTVKNVGSITLKNSEFTFLINGTNMVSTNPQANLYPEKQTYFLIAIPDRGPKNIKTVAHNGISAYYTYGG